MIVRILFCMILLLAFMTCSSSANEKAFVPGNSPLLLPGDGSLLPPEPIQPVNDEDCEEICSVPNDFVPPADFLKPSELPIIPENDSSLGFKTTDLSGKTVSSKEIFSGHKVTLLNIWSTTCSACMTELPALNRMNDEYAKKGGQVIGLVYDADEDDLILEAQEIVADLGIDFLNILPNEEVREHFAVQSFPSTYFINEKGEILGDPVMGAQTGMYRKILDSYLSE